MLEKLFEVCGFTPDTEQRKAVKSTKGPNFIKAGAGTGKTAVIVWYLIHLIVVLGVDPKKIYVATFTEKAAKNLKFRLHRMLHRISKVKKKNYDISGLTISTVHASCQHMLKDSRFYVEGEPKPSYALLDPTDQYMLVSSRAFWNLFLNEISLSEEEFKLHVKDYFQNRTKSKPTAVRSLLSLFNRWSEENLSTEKLLAATPQHDEFYPMFVKIYKLYLKELEKENKVDFSTLQQVTLKHLKKNPNSSNVYEYVVIDEYQDTSQIQEELFFHLARGHQNLTVVGDSDQSIFRFRSAVVENFNQFSSRCTHYGLPEPSEYTLSINYRSRSSIVQFSERFMEQTDWQNENGERYRNPKVLTSHKQDDHQAVIATSHAEIEQVAEETADLVESLLQEKKVKDFNQIAFLFPTIRNNESIEMYKNALSSRGIDFYAPRTNKLLEMDVPRIVVGILLKVFGMPAKNEFVGDYGYFLAWLEECDLHVSELMRTDPQMKDFIRTHYEEVERSKSDYIALKRTLLTQDWDVHNAYLPSKHKKVLQATKGLSSAATFRTKKFDDNARDQLANGNPFSLQYIIHSASSLDWSCLDFFWRMQGLDAFKHFFDPDRLEENTSSLTFLKQMTKYLAKFTKDRKVITGGFLTEDKFVYSFFSGFLYPLFCLGDTEEENKLENFPSGKIPFLSIHQAKGLEFPVVFLGVSLKRRRVSRLEEIVRPAMTRELETLERIDEFDSMRKFYVGLTRAINLLVILHPRGRGQTTFWAFKPLLQSITRVPQYQLDTLPQFLEESERMQPIYSLTGDILPYLQCPKQYMVFKKLGFIRSRSQLQLFGDVIHKTLEDINNLYKKNQGADFS